MDVCMHEYIGSLDAIADELGNATTPIRSDDDDDDGDDDGDNAVRLSCCANMRFKTCMMTKAKKACRHDEGAELRAASTKVKRAQQRKGAKQATKAKLMMRTMMSDIESTLEGMTLSGPELICRGLKDEFCRASFDARFAGRQPRHKSIVPALLAIYSHK